MGRLTTEKDVKEMGMYELAHNSCYAKDGVARYRDFETDIDCRDLARKLMVDYGLWKGIPEHGLDADNELVDDDIFDESILENLWYGLDTLEGLIALFYRNLWAMADLRTKLKNYEDMEEQGRLIELPCAVGDTVWVLYTESKTTEEKKVIGIDYEEKADRLRFSDGTQFTIWDKKWNEYLGKFIFSTKEEAEAKLKEVDNG